VGVIKSTAASSAYCLSAAGTVPGAAVQASPCSADSPAQQMVMRTDLSIFNPASGLCLDAGSGAYTANMPLQLNTCNGNQSQKFTAPGGYPGTYKSALGGSCLSGGSVVGNGTPISLNGCSSSNVNWVFTPI
jgi:hypothetical protein